PHAIELRPTGHIREDDLVTLSKAFSDLHPARRDTSDPDLDSRGRSAPRIDAEEAEHAVCVRPHGPREMEHVVEAVELDETVDVQVGARGGRQLTLESHVDGDGSFHGGRVYP